MRQERRGLVCGDGGRQAQKINNENNSSSNDNSNDEGILLKMGDTSKRGRN